MSKVVYTTTDTKPGVEIMLANARSDLATRIGLRHIEAQGLTDDRPEGVVGSFVLCFKLTDEGESLLFNGTVGPGDFKSWPTPQGPEVNWTQYPVDR